MGNAYDYAFPAPRAVSLPSRDELLERIRRMLAEAAAVALEWGHIINVEPEEVADAYTVKTAKGETVAYVFTLKTGVWISVNLLERRVDHGSLITCNCEC